MTSRERVLSAINRRKPDRVPRLLYGEVIGYTPAVENMLKDRCAPQSPREYFDMDITGVAARPTRLSRERFREWVYEAAYKDSGRLQEVDEWGVWWRGGSFHHFAHIESPLSGVESPEKIKEYPWPDLDQAYRFEGMADEVAGLHAEGMAVAGFPGSVFEQAWYIRGMESLLQDMLLQPEVAHFMYDRTAYFQKAGAVEMAKAGVDVIMLGDDVATQMGLMMHPDTWREFLKPRLADTIGAVKAVGEDARIFYHSDGKVEPLIPELIEVGVEILNPVQPECMDPASVKRKYGNELCFWGTIGLQQTMSFGTPQDVREEVQTRLRTVGYDGGLILAPSHVLEPEVPWENIVAFFQAADDA
ncbi:MAG: uroporphyrinogen decarboxylase family protein [Planctomycetota bacterium]